MRLADRFLLPTLGGREFHSANPPMTLQLDDTNVNETSTIFIFLGLKETKNDSVLQYIPRRDGKAFKCMGCCTREDLWSLFFAPNRSCRPLACLSLGRMGLAKPSCLGNPVCGLEHSGQNRPHPHDQMSSGKGAMSIVATREATLEPI